MNIDETPRMLLATPADLLCAVPYLLGFHPVDSLVVAGFTGWPPDGRLRLTTRWDLPVAAGSLRRLPLLLGREGVAQVMLVGFGAGALVTPAVDEAARLLREAGIEVAEALRAEGGRYWSYLCRNVRCCPAEGVPYDAVASPIAAQATMHGMVALPDRTSLERSVAPLDGPMRQAMRQATARAVAEVGRDLAAAACPDAFAAAYVTAGLGRVRAALRAYGRGDRLCDDEAARLGLDLAVIRIRDEAWTLLDDATIGVHLDLWRDLTRRLEPRFTPPAASLLGVAAWRNGDCALAGIAVERALAADPAYSLARLLQEGLRHLISPNILRSGMPSPQDLDEQMGRPTAAWLTPLVALLDDDADRSPGPKAVDSLMAPPSRDPRAG
ncbi:DUF4192 domain-containing protein [Thermopolyspora sp. NPDC052614]|uniref:DUF4192 domain-containing protein n=1 Tax=Thermopolyspora sp. NPDC052614 TaxID=3155682 RepID=UPI00343515C3